MKSSRRGQLVKHVSEKELEQAITNAQKADETRLVRRLCYIKNLYQGDTREEAGKRVGVSRATTHRWARAWNNGGVNGLRPIFGGGRPAKLTPAHSRNSVRLSKLDNLGRHEKFTRSLRSVTASRITQLTSAESSELRE